MKLSFYAVLFLDGCAAPVLFVIAKPVERRPGVKGFFAVLASILGTIYLSFGCVLAAIKLSASKSPLVGLANDPFFSTNRQTLEGNLRVSRGNRHSKLIDLFKIIVFTLSIFAALFCTVYVVFLASSYGSR